MGKIRLVERADFLKTATALRNIADQIENGDWGEVRQVVMALENTDTVVECFSFGPMAYDPIRAMGLWRLAEDYLIDRIVRTPTDGDV